MWAETMLPLPAKSEIYQRCDISLWTLHLHHYHHRPTNVLWASALHQMPLFAFIILFFKKQFYLLFFFFLIFGCAGSSLLCGFFSSCGKRGLLFVVVQGLLIVVASLIAEHGL